MQKSEKNYKRIVIKIGSSILSSADAKGIDSNLLDKITSQVADLIKQKKEVVIVSSGAIACGMSLLNFKARPTEFASLQSSAAVGQVPLMVQYCNAFSQRNLNCAQILLTWDDFNDRKRYLKIKNTITKLLELGAVPIINENDTVSTDEIKFGDNDKLSALVANLIHADLLLILSDVEGLLSEDRKKVIRLVDEITPAIKKIACGSNKKSCVGGMITKIEAAKEVMGSGIPCVIVNGKKEGVIVSVVDDITSCGTLFASKGEGLEARKRWIAYGAKAKGKIIIDDGAVKALIENHKSLLSVGITAVDGHFDAGSIVSIIDKHKNKVGCGICVVSSDELKKIMGERYHKEIIHRDNLVIL